MDSYLAALPEESRRLMEWIRRTIRSAAPAAEEVISYGMPAYRDHGIVVYVGAFTTHCSLFVGSPASRARFARELRPFSGGKGTVRFTTESRPSAALVRRIVRFRVRENRARWAANDRRRSSPARARTRRPPPIQRA